MSAPVLAPAKQKATETLSVRQSVLQQCTCGGTPGPTGECAECRRNRLLQAKLIVNTPGDRYEREAGRVAGEVMKPASDQPTTAPLRVQRVERGDGSEGIEAPPIVDEVLRSPGQPLDASTRAFMQSRLGHDFSSVRVHTDARAAASTRAVRAQAYTVGRDVVFGAGHYAPGTSAGQRLLAHELAHVVQQRGTSPGEKPVLGSPGEPQEAEAETAATRAVRGDAVKVMTRDEHQTLRRNGGPILSGMRSPGEDSSQEPGEEQSSKTMDALERSLRYMPGGAGQELARFLTDPVFIGSLIAAVGLYLALWLAPEPVFTKLAAAATTVAVLTTGAFSVSLLVRLARLWSELEAAVSAASTDAELEQAAAAFGRQMGAAEADLLVFLAMLLVPGPRRVPAPTRALADAERAIIQASETGGVVASGSGFSANVIPLRPPAPARSSGSGGARAFDGNAALRIQPEAPVAPPARTATPAPAPLPPPAQAPAGASPVMGGRTAVAGTVGAGIAASGPAPRPDVDTDLAYGHSDEYGCEIEPIAQQFGRYPCHADYARSLSGVSREFRVTTPGGITADFDAMDWGGALYEVKTGYRWIPFTADDPTRERIRQSTIGRFIEQSQRQMVVAERCHRTLDWYFNDNEAAEFFDMLVQPPVHHVPFDCNRDSDR